MSKREPPNPDDPVDYYLEEKSKNWSDNTFKNYRTALRHLQSFLDEKGMEAGEMQEPDAIDFLEYIEEESSAEAADQYSKLVRRFYGFYARRGTFETNPIAIALEDWVYETEYKEQIEIPIEDLREICQNEVDPLRVLLFTFLPKTGVRIGELQRMNLSDVHLQHPIAQDHTPEPRPEIQDEPDTLFIPPVLGGEKRKAGTHVPIDDELKQTLLYWISTYLTPPEYEEAHPLVQNRRGGGTGDMGARPNTNTIRDWITDTAEEYGWWESGGSYQKNLTPHSFRHFFTTYAAHDEYGGEMDRDVVEYIRGDTGNVDTLDEYHHRWGKDTQKEYLSNIFKLYE